MPTPERGGGGRPSKRDRAREASPLSLRPTFPTPRPPSPHPRQTHTQLCAAALCSLRGTVVRRPPDRCLVFKPNRLMPFETYVDSSWESKFSCSGAMLFVRGCLFMWFVKTQRSVSLSSAEAEYFGAMLAAREVIFHRELFVDLMFALDGPTIIYTDSKSAIDMSYDPVAFKKTKHILRAAQFLRDLVARDGGGGS